MKALRLSEVAELLGGELVGTADPLITGAAGLEEAGPGDLTFLARKKLTGALASSQATAVIVGPGMEPDRPAIRVADPYPAFARFLEKLAPDTDRVFPPGIHPTAVIDPEAQVDRDVALGPYCVISAGAVIGPGTRLGPHVVVGCDVTIGRDCLIYPLVNIRERCTVGDRVILHSGVVIGADGFGYLPSPEGFRKVPQVGLVEIQNDVEIGAGSCVDRATTGRTVVGAGSKIDNLVQIGHNVKIGKGCSLSAQTGIAGSCTFGDGVFTGGQVGIADHLRIGNGVKVGAQSGVITDLADGRAVFGCPAEDVKKSLRMSTALRRLPELLQRIQNLENELAGKPDIEKEQEK